MLVAAMLLVVSSWNDVCFMFCCASSSTLHHYFYLFCHSYLIHLIPLTCQLWFPFDILCNDLTLLHSYIVTLVLL